MDYLSILLTSLFWVYKDLLLLNFYWRAIVFLLYNKQSGRISRDVCQLALQHCFDSQHKLRDEEMTNERPQKRNMEYSHQWTWNGYISSRRHWLKSSVFHWSYKDSLCLFCFSNEENFSKVWSLLSKGLTCMNVI